MEWLSNYFVESPELNDLAALLPSEKIITKTCSLCGRPLALPESRGEYEGYVCVSCSDDAIHDYAERR